MRRVLGSGLWLSVAGAAALLYGSGDLAAKPKKPAADKGAAKKAIDKVKWGEADGKEVDLYTLTNKNGLIAKITNYGCIITELHTPDKAGKMGDIVHGYDNLAAYIKKNPYFGATVGRYGNRIANA